jgi:hypothetical protein
MNDKETEVIAGLLDSIVSKGEAKWQIKVLPAESKYTKSIWTKSQEMCDALTPQIGQAVTILCNVSHWTNQEGKPVRSLWAESVGNGSGPVQQAIQAVQESKAAVAAAPDPTRSSIERQVSLNAAVEHHKGEVDPTEVIHTAALFYAYLQDDPSWLDAQIKLQLEKVPF